MLLSVKKVVNYWKNLYKFIGKSSYHANITWETSSLAPRHPSSLYITVSFVVSHEFIGNMKRDSEVG